MDNRAVRKIFSRVGLGMALFIAIQQVIVGIVSVIVTMQAPDLMNEGWYIWVLSYVPLYLVAFPVLCLIYRTIPDGKPVEPALVRLSVPQILLLVAVSLGIVFPLNGISTLLSMLIGTLKGSDVVNPLGEVVMNSDPWINILFVVIIAPIMEEIVFRRFLYNKLIPFGGKTFVIISALIFALFHGNIFQIPYAFVLGALFAGITYFTGTIRWSVILHILINLFGSGVSVLLLAYAGEAAIAIWGLVIILITVTGIILGIAWWVKNRRLVVFAPAETPLPGKKPALLNFGMMLYFIIMLALIILATFM